MTEQLDNNNNNKKWDNGSYPAYFAWTTDSETTLQNTEQVWGWGGDAGDDNEQNRRRLMGSPAKQCCREILLAHPPPTPKLTSSTTLLTRAQGPGLVRDTKAPAVLQKPKIKLRPRDGLQKVP